MAQFWQQVVSGLASGGIYASLALAIVLIYRSTRVINFAQGEMGMFTTFIAWWLVTDVGWPYWGAFFATLARSEEHTSELQSRPHLVCRLLLEKKKHTPDSHPRASDTSRSCGRDKGHFGT